MPKAKRVNNEPQGDNAMKTTKGTPTHSLLPWKIEGAYIIDSTGKEVLDDGSADGEYGVVLDMDGPNAALIVRAVNAYEEMLEALYMALPYVETALTDQGYKPGAVERKVKQIKDAIARAEGK